VEYLNAEIVERGVARHTFDLRAIDAQTVFLDP
jgi:hypothetical protein